MALPSDPALDSLSDPQLVARIREGDALAERVLFDRYYVRMVGFARSRMNPRLAARVAASDIAASAMKSVLLGVRPGRFDVESEQSLWPLLVTVTLNKLRNQWRHHTAQRQDARISAPLDAHALLVDEQSQAEGNTELQELVERLLAQFSDRRKDILRMALEGYGVGETAAAIGVSERTVYDTRRQAAGALQRLLEAADR